MTRATREEMAAAMDAVRVRNATLREPEWWRQAIGSNLSITGHNVTPDSAMSVTAVFGCVRVLAESVASLPMMVYRRLPNGGKEVATDHPLYRLLHASPNRDQTAFEAGEYRMASLALRGNSYSAKLRSSAGKVGELQPLRPQHMHLDRRGGRLFFDYREPGAEKVYSQDQIWYTRGFSNDGVSGLSPIGVCRDAVAYAMTLNEHGSRIFANGAKVPGVLEVPGEMSDTAYGRLQTSFTDKHEGAANAGKTLILEGGAKYTQIGMNAADAEFIAAQKMQIAEVARIFRVPLHMLAEMTQATFSNIEHQSLEFVTHTLRPWLVRIEQSASRDLFSPAEQGEYFVEHKLDALLRGDTKSRYEAYGKAIVDGWMSRQEVRKLENLNPEEGLDEFLVPLNMAGANDPKPEPTPAPADPAPPEPEPQPDNRLAAQIKAVAVERDRLADAPFAAWVADYFARQSAKDGEDYTARLDEVLTLGAAGAIDKWSAGNA